MIIPGFYQKNYISIFHIGFSIILLVLYIFNIVPKNGLPKLGTREYISIVATIYLICIHAKLPKIIWILYLSNISQIFFSVLTVVINGTEDFWYVQFAIRNVLYLSGAILIVRLLPKKFGFNNYLLCIVISVIINDIIAATAFVYPSFMQILLSFQQIDEELSSRTIAFAVRMIGLGNGCYYNGGVINGMGIITTVYLINKKYISVTVGGTLIIIMFVIGLFIARTTIVGTTIAIILFFRESNTKLNISLISVLSLVIGIIFISGIFDSIDTSHAFEIFQGIDGLLHNESVETLYTMYNKEFTFKTFLFGDGLSKIDGGYYMNTDVGWLRNIFYFGIIGTVFGYLCYEFILFSQWMKISNFMAPYIYALGAYLLILNFKGLPDFNYYVFLIIAFLTNKSKNSVSYEKYKTPACYNIP